jgi:2-keto-3-deoxy-L-rhamnonate aldolase RhmA
LDLRTHKKSFKELLKQGRKAIGIRTQFASPIVAEALGHCGYDYIYIDMEHSPADLLCVMQQCQAVEGTPSHPVVRISDNDPVLIQQLLDLGVENIVVPMVDTAEDAKRVVAATRYPPTGIRSMARMHRGNRYGFDKNYVATATDRICVIVQAETQVALNNIDAIALTPELDGILFGPADLSASMGFGGGDHPDMTAAIKKAIGQIRQAGKFAGMSTSGSKAGLEWLAAGCDFASVGGDIPLLVNDARRIASEIHAGSKEEKPSSPRPADSGHQV